MARPIKVVFRSDVRGVAQAGDVKAVAAGFARNYLLPRNIAFVATPSALRQWETERHVVLTHAVKLRADVQALAEKLDGMTVTLTAKVSPEGALFGSINRNDILAALEKQNYTVEKGALLLDAPIKSVGIHSVILRLGSGVSATLKVEVVGEQKTTVAAE